MSKQSEAKAKQNYRKEAACCNNCKSYRADVTAHPAAFSWSEPYTTEKNRRCDIGGFAVQATGHCTFFAWASV